MNLTTKSFSRLDFGGARATGVGNYARQLLGFTMIEIALSLAVIGFALVAIIGILPLGMSVQRENREETIIAHDASMLMEAIRSGAQGMDDLTNYVISITNAYTDYRLPNRSVIGTPTVVSFTPTNSSPPGFPLTNGFRIVGLLTTPKFVGLNSTTFRSNFIVANIRSMSGAASEKFPQNNELSRDFGLSYRLISEVTTYGSPISNTITNNAWDVSWVNYAAYPINTPEYTSRLEYSQYASGLRNLHDIRLLFRWPLLTGGKVSKAGWQVFRATAGGSLVFTTEPGLQQRLYFIQPTTYLTNSL